MTFSAPNFLASSFALLYLLKCASAQFTCPPESELDAKVIILGAGISGVAAAKSLYENGITDIKIIEARSEIGGRIQNVEFAGVKVETGANWIHHLPDNNHAVNDHPIWKLAKETEGCHDLSGVPTETSEVWDWSANDNRYVKLSSEESENLSKKFMNAWESVLEVGKELKEQADANDVGITVRTGFKEEIADPWVPQSRLDNLTEWCGFDFEFAETPDVSSLFGYLDDDEDVFGDTDFLITDQNGFVSVVDCIAREIEDKIMLNTLVNSINWADDCVCANVMNTVNQQQDTICGKYGIVTFSIGVLQEWINTTKFHPPVSVNKQKAINAISMGYYLKIFLDFPKRFWNKKVDYILRADEKRGYFPVIQPIGALVGCPNMILMTVVDDLAVRVSVQDVETTKAEIVQVLRELYPDADVPKPSAILVPDWYSDPLFRGMFSNTHIGLTEQHKDDLAQPDGNLYFSGEGISKELSGYLEGAYCTGLDVSERILTREGMDTTNSNLPDCSFMSPLLNEKEVVVNPPSSGTNEKASIVLLVSVGAILFSFL